VDNRHADVLICGDPRKQQKKQQEQVESLRDLSQSEAEDLQDLVSIASEATLIAFDSRTGRPVSFPNDDGKRCKHDDDSPIAGLVKLSNDLLLKNDPDLFHDLKTIHAIVKEKVHIDDMVPWAGTGGDSTRLQAFGFVGKSALHRLDHDSSVRLHAPEKHGREARLDEGANRKAICILNKNRELIGVGIRAETTRSKNVPMNPTQFRSVSVNPTSVADKLCAAICTANRNNDDDGGSWLNSDVLSSKELIAYQTNLHNGAKHLAAHLDAPLHEGFGKVIVTVAIRESATILLIGKGDDSDDDEDTENEDEKSDRGKQPAWKFHLKEGEAYVLSGNVRNTCLHAVLADGSGGERQSLNLRFGLHTIKEADNDIKRHWPNLW